jgi:hypothetical protein
MIYVRMECLLKKGSWHCFKLHFNRTWRSIPLKKEANNQPLLSGRTIRVLPLEFSKKLQAVKPITMLWSSGCLRNKRSHHLHQWLRNLAADLSLNLDLSSCREPRRDLLTGWLRLKRKRLRLIFPKKSVRS